MNDIDKVDIRLQYRIDVDNIEHIKQRQWLGMYYSLLLYVVIYFLRVPILQIQMISKESAQLFLFLFTTGIYWFSLWFLTSTKGTLNKYRSRQKDLAELMCERFKKILPPEDILGKKGQDIVLLSTFSGIHFIGWIFLALLILELPSELLSLLALFGVGLLSWIMCVASILIRR